MNRGEFPELPVCLHPQNTSPSLFRLCIEIDPSNFVESTQRPESQNTGSCYLTFPSEFFADTSIGVWLTGSENFTVIGVSSQYSDSQFNWRLGRSSDSKFACQVKGLFGAGRIEISEMDKCKDDQLVIVLIC